jgi:flavin-dependent dehydrogenase
MKILIAGAGTAGWIAAYYITKANPGDHDITVIESSKIGIIGAGEGSTGSMLDLLTGKYFPYSIDIDEFMAKTDGTHKLGIYHQNWNGDNEGYFAPIDASSTWAEHDDYIFKYVYTVFGKDKMHVASPIGQQYESKNPQNFALHFDGHKVGQFFKEKCLEDGVTVIDDVILDATVNSNGDIKSVILEDGSELEAEFFIDCTGFKRILMNKLNTKWVSYKEYLPVNTAMPFLVDYEDGEEIPLYTKATALKAGWMWTIPLQSRKGSGYVFDSNYITREQAQQEVEEYLGKKIKPIKFIEFDSGRNEVLWKNNVLALGLSAAFAEPLEATSIHSTITQMYFFNEYLTQQKESTVTSYNQESYNRKITRLYDLNFDFISYHYQTMRDDTEFWKDIKNKECVTPNAKIYLDRSKHKIPSILETDGLYGTPTAALWNWISAGLGIITQDQAKQELLKSNNFEKAEQEFIDFVQGYNLLNITVKQKEQTPATLNANKKYITYT